MCWYQVADSLGWPTMSLPSAFTSTPTIVSQKRYACSYEVTHIQAPTVSHFMSLASSLIFRRTQTVNQHTVHPYIHSFSHHRSVEKMCRAVSFPDVVPSGDVNLHFKPGDFLKLFPLVETHDAVATLFFIDTVSSVSVGIHASS